MQTGWSFPFLIFGMRSLPWEKGWSSNSRVEVVTKSSPGLRRAGDVPSYKFQLIRVSRFFT